MSASEEDVGLSQELIKKCRGCKQEKSTHEFYFDKSNKAFRSRCKKCDINFILKKREYNKKLLTDENFAFDFSLSLAIDECNNEPTKKIMDYERLRKFYERHPGYYRKQRERLLRKISGKSCTINWCNKPRHDLRYCAMHQHRFYNGIDMDLPPFRKKTGCLVDGCEKPHVGRGYCCIHYNRKFQYTKLRIKRYAVKTKVIKHYSNGSMVCKCCGEKHFHLLTVDHVARNGNEERKKLGTGTKIYPRLIRLGYPPGYQILCFSCNCGREFYNGICPHEFERRSILYNELTHLENPKGKYL